MNLQPTEQDAYWRSTQQRGQLAMTGDDWISDRDKKSQAKANAHLKKTSIEAAAKMRSAAEALRKQLRAYIDAGHPDRKGLSDGRLILASDLDELAAHFESVYE